MKIVKIEGDKLGTRVGCKVVQKKQKDKKTKKAYVHDFNFITRLFHIILDWKEN